MKKVLCLIFLLLCYIETAFGAGCTGSSGTYVCTDDFARADGLLGVNWTKTTTNEFSIVTQQATPVASGTDILEYWNTVTFQNSQYALVTLAAFNGVAGTGPGLCIRCQAGGITGYRIIVSNAGANNVEVRRFKQGQASSVICTVTQAFSANDILRAEVDSGYNFTLYKNGTSFTTCDGSADANKLSSGFPGLSYSSTSTGRTLDNWEGGDLGGGGGANTKPCSVVICGDDVFP